MDYYESADDTRITRARVIQELKAHDCEELDLFDNEVQSDENGMYNAQQVLRWLGY